MHKYLQSVRDSFMFFDRDRSGNLDLGELYQALSRAGFMLSQQVRHVSCSRANVCASNQPTIYQT